VLLKKAKKEPVLMRGWLVKRFGNGAKWPEIWGSLLGLSHPSNGMISLV
jgi:hypothetical protein